MTERETLDRVKRMLVTRFELDFQPKDLADDEPIFAGRLGLDSMAAMDLIAGVEEAFTLVIDDEDLLLTNFETPVAISSFVNSKRPASSGS